MDGSASHPRNTTPSINPFEIAGDAAETAERTTLPFAETTSVLPRPKEVSHLWVEDEYEQLAHEQKELWSATAAQEARGAMVRQAGLRLEAGEAEHAVAQSRELLDKAGNRFLEAQRVLAQFRRRAVGTKIWYQLAKAALFLGDLAGFATAAIWLGELMFIAITLAVSAATATVVAGLIGTGVSDMHRRSLRERPHEELQPEEIPFAHLFRPAQKNSRLVKRVLLVSAFTALMVSVGIGSLRAAVDDPLVGLIFAGIAFAVAGGSFLVSFAGADEIADLIDLHEADYLTQQKRHLALAGNIAWRQREEAGEEAASAEAEFTARGKAAMEQMQALKWRILRKHPSHAGHGPRADDTIGRAARKGAK